MADANFVMQAPVGAGWVHQGYFNELNKLWDDVSRDIRTYRDMSFPPIPIWVTGHSLGAAMATLVATRGIPLEAVITFGEPMVGHSYASAFTAKQHLRYVNGDDPAIYYPLPFGYEHHGKEIKINEASPNILYDHAIIYYVENLTPERAKQ